MADYTIYVPTDWHAWTLPDRLRFVARKALEAGDSPFICNMMIEAAVELDLHHTQPGAAWRAKK